MSKIIGYNVIKMCGNIFPAYQRNESNTKCVKIKSILGRESSLGKNVAKVVLGRTSRK